MKLIIAGSRDIEDYDEVVGAVETFKEKHPRFRTDSIVSGCARGVDRLGERYAQDNGLIIHPKPANWDKYGKKAGKVRNYKMAHFANGLVAVWDGKSNGTAHMISWANVLGLYTHVRFVKTT